ncbi:MAG TPA: hypothetical protein VLW52_04195, partial [Opitutaceae bacterium]|nr:hypothetical protein [Opitutaceae bacterium]
SKALAAEGSRRVDKQTSRLVRPSSDSTTSLDPPGLSLKRVTLVKWHSASRRLSRICGSLGRGLLHLFAETPPPCPKIDPTGEQTANFCKVMQKCEFPLSLPCRHLAWLLHYPENSSRFFFKWLPGMDSNHD